MVPLHPTETDSGATAILEAMAMGKAVICSRVRGQVGIVEEGKTGLLVTPGDALELHRAIQYLADPPDMAQSMGRAGRQMVERRHRLGTFVDRVKMVVQEDAFSMPSPACEGG